MTPKMQLFLVYLFIPKQFYMFRAMSSPIIRSTWLYLQLLIFSIDIAAAAGVMDEMELHDFHLIHDTKAVLSQPVHRYWEWR